MEREDPFYPDTSGYPSYCEVGSGSFTVLEAYDDSLEHLNPLPFTLANAEVDLHRIAGSEVRDVRVGLGFK